MTVLVATISRPTKGRLEREAIYQVEFTPHDYASSGLTGLLNREVATVETKIFRILTK